MKTILKKVVRTNFTVVPNYLTEDPDLSWKAKGMLVYLLGRPQNWEINIPHLATISTDGENSTRSGFAELEAAGYAHRLRHTNEAGQVTSWSVYVRQDKNDAWPFEPDGGNPHVDNPDVEKPHVENRDQVSKDITKNVLEPKKEEPNAVETIWNAYVESLVRFKPSGRKPVLSEARKALIRRRLANYSVEDLVLAVTGWEHSTYHCGDNDDGKIYNTLELLLRNDEKIERFIGYHDVKKPAAKQTIDEQWDREPAKTPSAKVIVNEDWDD